MLYQKENPALALEPFVECYFFMSSDHKFVTNTEIESPPTGFPGMIFNLGDLYQAKSNGGEPIVPPRCFVIGQTTRRYTLQFDGVIDIVGIVFKPTALYHLFGLSMPLLTERRVDISYVFGLKEGKNIYEQVAKSEGISEKVKTLNRIFKAQAEKVNAVCEVIDESIDLVDGEYGNISVAQLASYCNMSSRNYQRKFTEMVGISPKHYAKLRRMSLICNIMSYVDDIDWQEVVHIGGYFDQSHFIKEFHGFIGRKPTLYFQKNKELIHYLEES